MSAILRSVFSAAVLLLLCSACCCTSEQKSTTYFGPTRSMAEVVEQINKNNQDIPTLWASHYFEADIRDEQTGKTHFVNGDGVLLFKRPMGFRLVGTKEIGNIFEVGSDDQYYWLKLLPEISTMWFGEHKNLGKPCVQSIPIQPNLVTEVLGIGLINTNFTEMPAPVMRFNPDADCYMFVWDSPVGGPATRPARLAAQKEIWYDRKTYLPRKVILFDDNGRVLLHALLDKHKPVGENGGQVATSYRLFFPDSRSKISIDIRDLRLDNKGLPTRRGIAFPGDKPADAGVNKVIKLDKDCKD